MKRFTVEPLREPPPEVTHACRAFFALELSEYTAHPRYKSAWLNRAVGKKLCNVSTANRMTAMRLDFEIERDVEAELKWAPEVDETAVAIKVQDGVVTLSGSVKSSFERYRAERAARRVKGVAAIANEIVVRVPGSPRSDTEIAHAAANALKLDMPVNHENIQAVVHEGHVSLLGHVEWHYQRELAEKIMHRVYGVVSVRNSIQVKPRAGAEKNVKQHIEAAFKRLAHIDAEGISVEAAGSEITLRGEVRSWAEHDQAQATAWSAPGVTSVRNELAVRS